MTATRYRFDGAAYQYHPITGQPERTVLTRAHHLDPWYGNE